jgi:NitT/TauT family transport system substrate-binding protein
MEGKEAFAMGRSTHKRAATAVATWMMVTAGFGISLLFVAGCNQEAPSPEEKPLRIAVLVWPGYAHAYVAQKKGFFEEKGVKVELTLKENYVDVLDLYKDGQVDGVFTLLPDVVMMTSQGVSARIAYIPDLTVTADGIVGKPEFDSLAELKGKTVAFEGMNSFAHVFVQQALEEAGLKEGEVRFKNMPAMEVLSVLEAGEIDAGHTWEPVITRAKAKGYKVLAYSSGVLPAVIVDVLAFSAATVSERPADIRAVVASLLKARDFVMSNREEAVAIMAEAEGMSEEEMASGLDGIRLPDLEENRTMLRRSDESTSLYASARVVTDFYMKRGQLSVSPDLDEIIDPRFLP